MMNRHDGEAAARNVSFEHSSDQDLSCRIQIRRRFVEQPQRHAHEREARQRHAPALAGGERAHRAIAPFVGADFIQRAVDLRRGRAACACRPSSAGSRAP